MSVKEFIKSYKNGSLSSVVGVIASVKTSIKQHAPVRIFLDKDGDWQNRSSKATFVATDLHAVSFDAVKESVLDQWCHDYKLKEGDIVIDVGAGIGDDVLIFSRLVGVTGRVIAIEAHPRTYRCLLKTIKLNDLTNVTPVNVAVSDQDGEIGMSYGDSYQSSSIVTGGRFVQVKARRLDEILSDFGVSKPTLVKMNIEGAETLALKGMPNALHKVPNIVISCHDFIADGGGDPALRTYSDVKTILQDAGFILLKERDDSRPWFRNYVYGHRRG